MPAPTGWSQLFGADYAVPSEITSTLPDQSYGNDACPAFGRNQDDDDVTLWVEHPDPAQRELSEVEHGPEWAGRFTVTYCNGEHIFYNGDDMTEALRVYVANGGRVLTP
jgi:hypothetical protein